MIVSFPSMLYGWPCMAAINRVNAHAITTIVGIVVQFVGFAILLFTQKFTLEMLIVVIGVAETIVTVLRFVVVYKNKNQFVLNQSDLSSIADV